jgi:hypothetical protein
MELQPDNSVDQAPVCFPKIEPGLPKGRGGGRFKIQVTQTDHGWQPRLMEISSEGALFTASQA